MLGRNRLIVIFAIVLGIIAGVLVWSYMGQVQREAEKTQKVVVEQPKTIAVVVAIRDIPVRTTITASMLQIKDIPVTAKHPNAFTKLTDVEGKITKLPISTGEQVISDKFVVQREEAGLSYMIPPGMRAVSVAVSEEIGSGGLILPGDFVDVIAIFDNKTMGKDEAATILQRVEVLAVAQVVQGETMAPEAGALEKAGQAVTNQPTPTPVVKQQAQPKARTVTLAVTPEEAQRLALAEARGELRLTLRPFNEGSTADLAPAVLGSIMAPAIPSTGLIVAFDLSPTNARVGDTLFARFSVKNTSTVPIRSQGPPPGFIYSQGQTFHSQGFASETGTVRVGLNLNVQSPVSFPYRWGLGGDLAPGVTTVITGFVKLTADIKSANIWAGLIREPASVLQDNVGSTVISVIPMNTAVIAIEMANVRGGPNIDSGTIAELKLGTQVTILSHEGEWYKVRLADNSEGWVTASWIASPPAGQ